MARYGRLEFPKNFVIYGLSYRGSPKTTFMNTIGRELKCCSALVGVVLAVAGCTNEIDTAQGIPLPAGAAKAQASESLSPGDVISVAYPRAAEMNLSQKIRPDGRVSLPIIGDVTAAGRTLPAFQKELHRRYSAELQDPKVVVSVIETAAAVYVWGAVAEPGKIPLDRPMNALEAIMEAGGFTPAANLKSVSVVRTENGTHKRYNLNMTKALTGEAPAFYVRPYDKIYVATRAW